ncbi:hypothetical protein ILUMI_20049 [Ignelater luminosus]|uniref:Uncharacterized protein n=1 Tax=Ignelater luminosus TaxID=2038154 RepID=A0A8K0G4X3_IGNLU|nr:hypothetical protein ILUMI_20049 [Ignelater luminosus]
MKFIIVVPAFSAFVQAERDLSKFTPRARFVLPNHAPPVLPKVVDGEEADLHQYPYMYCQRRVVVTLSSNINLDGTTSQAVRLYQGSNSLEGKEAIVSRWGRYSDSSGSISPVLRHASDKLPLTVPKVVAGEEAERHQYRYMVCLLYFESRQFD